MNHPLPSRHRPGRAVRPMSGRPDTIADRAKQAGALHTATEPLIEIVGTPPLLRRAVLVAILRGRVGAS